jgi:hypothetical protein
LFIFRDNRCKAFSQFREGKSRKIPEKFPHQASAAMKKPQMRKGNDFSSSSPFVCVIVFVEICFIDPKSLELVEIYDFLSSAINKTLLFSLHNHELNCCCRE